MVNKALGVIGKLAKIFNGTIVRPPRRSETNGVSERAVNSMKNGLQILWNMSLLFAQCSRSVCRCDGRCGDSFKRTNATEVLVILPCALGSLKLAGKGSELRPSDFCKSSKKEKKIKEGEMDDPDFTERTRKRDF